MENTKIVEQIRALALQAGDKIMEIYARDDFGVRTKADDSPVTEADEAADALISKGLSEAFPEIAIVTEEQSDSHSVSADRFFIVDPLDGTKEFVHRRGDFTVNIALVENGAPTLGVVFAPAKKRLFYTDASGQTVEESQDGTLTPLRVSTPDNDALVVVASKSHRDQATDDYINKYAVKDSKSAGSSLKFCLVATGEADIYPRVGRTMEWDTAAGHALIKAAGYWVTIAEENKPLVYNKEQLTNPWFIAAND